MVWQAALAGAAIVWSLPAAGQSTSLFSTGNDVLRTCAERQSDFRVGMCIGFIQGTVRRDGVAKVMAPGTEYLCELSGIENGQALDVVVRFLRSNPDRRHLDGSALVLIALKEAFCQK